ncbi:hypothetical protein EV426DRAFT_611066 [Tirmania nivea]|nr:hypothetical protein EV426DRAFT_611066 [Tirmania nivea]
MDREITKPLPPIYTTSTTSTIDIQGPPRDAAISLKNDMPKIPVLDIMKELPPITQQKEDSETEWGELQGGGSTTDDGIETPNDSAATADSTPALSAGLAALSVGPANPDSFAPGKVPVTIAEKEESLDGEHKQEWGQSEGKERALSSPPPPPPPKDRVYLDTTPMTPLPSAPSSVAGTPPKKSPLQPGLNESTGSPKQRSKNEASDDEDAQSEIHCILDQFEPGHEGHSAGGASAHYSNPTSPVVMSRTHSFNVSAAAHPARTSSLEGLKALPSPPLARTLSQNSSHTLSRTSTNHSLNDGKQSPRVSTEKLLPTPGDVPSPPGPGKEPSTAPIVNQPTLHKPPPPELDPDLPFDFHRFLEQLRHRTADPVAKYLRSFLSEFSKKQWMVHEQVKIIHDFLGFITGKMGLCEVWREVSDQEFDNAKEGMEKLVMNRLYSQTFSPAIPPPNPPTPVGRRSRGRDMQMTGRRGQHQEDVERDEVLAQKVRIYGWVREEHLDIKPVGESGRKFLTLAMQELEKIKTYRAPRDKVICVLNCCKVIFGLLRHAADGDTSADCFVPLLIYVVLRANPEHLVSNVQYILRFRNPDKLGGEAGYYLSSLMGAIQFIESLDRSSLTITDAEFEKNVEAAVAAIAEKPAPLPGAPETDNERSFRRPGRQYFDGAVGEGSSGGQMRSVSPRPIHEKIPLPTTSSSSNYSNSNIKSNNNSNNDPDDPTAAVAGLLRTIQKPLSTIGRIFGEATGPGASEGGGGGRYAEEAAARQASAEAAEALRIQRAEHENVVGILKSMFPGLDKDLISDVVVQKEGRVGLAVDACLSLSSE